MIFDYGMEFIEFFGSLCDRGLWWVLMFWGVGFFFVVSFHVVGAMKNIVEFILGKQTHFGEQKGLGLSGGMGLNTLGTL